MKILEVIGIYKKWNCRIQEKLYILLHIYEYALIYKAFPTVRCVVLDIYSQILGSRWTHIVLNE